MGSWWYLRIRFCLAKSYFFLLKMAKHNKNTQKNAFFSKKVLQKVYLHGNIPFLTVGYIKKGEKCLFKGVFLPFKIVVWEASYEIFLIFLLRSLG